jgi:DNA repair protein RecO (recombination protein O)
MKLTDEAIVLSINTYSENSKIIKCLTKSHGIFSGFIKSSSGKNSNIMEGSLIKFHWSARLEEHIGTLKFEPIKSFAQNFLFDKKKLISVSCLLDITSSSFEEREYIHGLFELIYGYIEYISHNEFDFKIYIDTELEILTLAGYGLKLNVCGKTGEVENLSYVSPKTGCAISKKIGEEYRHKLLPLPNMQQFSRIDKQNALDLTKYFFKRYIYKNIRNKLPESRKFLIE